MYIYKQTLYSIYAVTYTSSVGFPFKKDQPSPAPLPLSNSTARRKYIDKFVPSWLPSQKEKVIQGKNLELFFPPLYRT